MDINPKIWRWVLVIVIVISWILGLAYTVPIDPWTRDMYEAIDALPEGTIVLMGVDSRLAQWGSYDGGYIAVTKHLMQKNCRIIFYGTMFVDIAQVLEDLLRRTNIAATKEYGVDYVNFGYLAGGASTAAAMAEDIPSILTTDAYGTPSSELPIMDGLQDASDIDFVCQGWSTHFTYRSLWGPKSKWGVPLVQILLGPNVAVWQKGEVLGFAAGPNGGAQYEILSGFPGASAITDTTTGLLQIMMLVAIIGGNIVYFWEKRKQTVKEAVE